MLYPNFKPWLSPIKVALHDARRTKQRHRCHCAGEALSSTPGNGTSVSDKKPIDVVRLKIGVNDRVLRICTHLGGAHPSEQPSYSGGSVHAQDFSSPHLFQQFIGQLSPLFKGLQNTGIVSLINLLSPLRHPAPDAPGVALS